MKYLIIIMIIFAGCKKSEVKPELKKLSADSIKVKLK